jgi:hypothetical protein
MLTICSWLWGAKYNDFYVDRLFASLRRNIKQPTRYMLITERARSIVLPEGVERHAIKDEDLCSVKGCFARLRMFDTGWQHNRGIKDRLVCIDLDAVITGPLDTLFDRPGDFHILQGCNASNPCPFNGSLMMLRAGTNESVWSEFSLEAAAALPYDSFPDDQGWLAVKLPNAAAWTNADGVYAFQKRGWPKGTALPANARVVAFPGWRDPSKFIELPWIKSNWRT